MLTEHNPEWPRQFAAEQERLQAVAPGNIEAVHHVGSTAVPGLVAEPVIDVLMVLQQPLEDAELEAMQQLGYELLGDGGIPGRQLLERKQEPAFRVHAFLRPHPATHAMLNFRNFLLATPEARAEFSAEKRSVAALPASEQEQAKDALLLQYDRRAAMWAAEREARRHRGEAVD